MRHGQLDIEVPIEVIEDDPDMAYIYADMGAYMEAFPCECEAGCVCEQEEE